MPKSPKSEEIELEPDAFERFERAVDTVSKSGPQPRRGAKKDEVESRKLVDDQGDPNKDKS
jgi:hypothetical protein